MSLKSIFFTAALSTVSIIASTSAQAQNADKTSEELIEASFIEDVGASERINYSGKLRMLSQRIPAAACFAHAKIEVEKSTELLHAATAEFDLITKGLEFGEESLNIKGEESDRKILIGLKKLNEIWDPLHIDIQDIETTGGTDEEVVHIADSSGTMLDIAKKLVSVISGEYTDPTALLQADALTIDIAGRQRMLAQRISKNVCLATSGLNKETAIAELAGARDMYAASVTALRFGLPDAGIKATKNPEILSGLDEIIALWEGVQPILSSVSVGEDIADEKRADIYNTMNKLTGKMNTLVGIYNDDSKLGL